MELKHSPSGGLSSEKTILDTLSPNADSAATKFTTIDIGCYNDNHHEGIMNFDWLD